MGDKSFLKALLRSLDCGDPNREVMTAIGEVAHKLLANAVVWGVLPAETLYQHTADRIHSLSLWLKREDYAAWQRQSCKDEMLRLLG